MAETESKPARVRVPLHAELGEPCPDAGPRPITVHLNLGLAFTNSATGAACGEQALVYEGQVHIEHDDPARPLELVLGVDQGVVLNVSATPRAVAAARTVARPIGFSTPLNPTCEASS